MGGVARSLDRTTSHTQKLKSFWPGRRIRDPAPGEKKSRKARARRPQILSLRSLLAKPEDSDPESEIQEEKESVRRNSGKTFRVPLVQWGDVWAEERTLAGEI